MFDIFEGLSQPELSYGFHWTASALACGENFVKANLALFEGRFFTYKGWVLERFCEVADLTFSFVHIDVDLHTPS